jgi:catechol 2,3-dioxygenase-like lactoylglutathione lyase family enzyme
MLTHPEIVTLIVSDQRQSLAFFRDYLGFEVRDDVDFMPGIRWITVAPQGAQTKFTLWPAGATGAEDKTAGGMTGISFACDDVQATHDELAAKGVQITQPLTRQPWGLQFMFSDPDGNLFNVVESSRA